MKRLESILFGSFLFLLGCLLESLYHFSHYFFWQYGAWIVVIFLASWGWFSFKEKE